MTDPTRSPRDGVWLNGRPVDPAAAVEGDSGRRPMAPMARAINVLALGLLAMPVVLGVVLALAQDEGAQVQAVPCVAGLLAGLAALVVIMAVGYRVAPLEAAAAGPDAERTALARFQTGFFLRFALAEAPALIAFALTFAVAPIAALNYLPGGVAALILIVWHVRPNRWNVHRAQAVLDRDGGRSNLPAQFGY